MIRATALAYLSNGKVVIFAVDGNEDEDIPLVCNVLWGKLLEHVLEHENGEPVFRLDISFTDYDIPLS